MSPAVRQVIQSRVVSPCAAGYLAVLAYPPGNCLDLSLSELPQRKEEPLPREGPTTFPGITVPPWRVDLTVDVVDGRLEVIEIRRLRRYDGSPIRAGDLHGFRLGAAAAQARGWFANLAEAAAT